MHKTIVRDPVAAIEHPCLAQDAGGDVESAVAHLVKRCGEVEHVGRFVVDLDRLAITAINSVNGIVGQVPAELVLNAPRLAGDDIE